MKPVLPEIDAPDGALEFLLGIIFNQAIRSEVAWRAPAGLRDRIGTLKAETLATMVVGELMSVITEPPVLHPFARTMARNVKYSCEHLCETYGGLAISIWDDRPTPRQLMARLTNFPGVGRHKAEVALFLLTRQYGIPVRDDGTALDGALSHCPRLYELYG